MVGQEDYQKKIEALKIEKQRITEQEKKALKLEVKEINERLDRGDLSEAEAKLLKEEAAKRRALNIENKVAILDNQIALLERNEDYLLIPEVFIEEHFFEEAHELLGINYYRSDFPRRDRRTHSNLVFGFGILNNIIEDKPVLELPHQILGSKSLELGWVWKTRVFKNSNWLRFTYGFSFQWNGLKTNNQLFVKDTELIGDSEPPIVVLVNANEFYGSPTGKLKKSKFRQTDLIFPIHFEFGPSKRKEYGDYVRYSTKNKFKLGLGAYYGINLETVQKIKYGDDFNFARDGSGTLQPLYFSNSKAARKSFFGLSAYAGHGNNTFFIKYDLTPNFREAHYYNADGHIRPVRRYNIAMGIRFEL